MTIDRRTFGKLVAATAGASAISMPFVRTASADEVAKLGVLLPLSGPLASLGNDVMRGFELAKNLVNEEGGVFGKPAELVVVDVPSSTEATSQATRLITSERVKVIMGSYASSISFAASQVAERNKVIYFEQGAVANDITSRGFKHLFRFIYPASELGGGAAKFMLETVAPQLGIENSALKVALLYEDSSYGTAVGESARAVLAEAGVNVVDATSYSYKTTDLSSMVQRYKQLQPDVLIVCQYTPDGILFWRQAREAGLAVKAMIGNGGAHNVNEFAEALGDDVNGIFNAGTSVYIDKDGLVPETAALFERFHTEHEKRYDGRKPSAHTGMGFNAMWTVLKDILPAAGSMDTQAIRDAALALDKPVGSTIVGWGVKFDPETQNNTRAFPTYDQWQGKTIKTVAPERFAIAEVKAIPLPTWGKRGDI
ncbi:ABC transporter substrate-binding protein [Tianweitania sediminis]|uniref:ABC transporter substrate-binding protein n=1 Tax=Tianweitania sediminis TaxID=1502156 RepID=A0A8J7R519_9HYPH|nr:ABC transporter substrate-binding protein [Tianweitania sediminis]MBP0437712.1 ABC transporter substrate-binding protein [Tianweitania sediminis]